MRRLLIAAALLSGRSSYAQPPSFDTVSIKPCSPSDHPPPAASSPGRLSLSCWPPSRLIQFAYDLFASGKVDPYNPGYPMLPVEGLPAWTNSERYTVDAIPATPQSLAMMRGPMMRTILETRFHLRAHHESREESVYLLTVAKGGPAIHPTTDSCRQVDPLDLTLSLVLAPGAKPWCAFANPMKSGSTFTWDALGVSLDLFARRLSIGLPVVNRTGLDGAYDIHLKWEADPLDATASNEPRDTSIAKAIRDQLGLQIERGKASRDYLVIDHIEKPSAN